MSTKLERLIRIDYLIRNRHYPNAQRVAAQYEVSERTVWDDVAFLKERLNAPVEFEPERGGWYYTMPSYVLPAFMATEGELLAFLLSGELAGSYLGSAYEAPLRRAITSLAQALPDHVQLDLGALAAHYSFVAGATAAANPRLLVDLNAAIHERRPVEVRYYTASRDARTERVLRPYALRNVLGDWQLVAHDSLRDAVRIFALARFEEWRVIHGETFAAPDDFSIDAYMATGFLNERGGAARHIAIRFDAYQSRYIRERRWHHSQQPLVALPDGGCELHFESGALDEIKRWVLQFGGHAEVLAPPELRAAVAAEVAALEKIYEDA